MRTIKFQNINDFARERHDHSKVEVINAKIFGQEIHMYSPCNLNIFICNHCSNKCEFCINKTYNDVSDDIYYNNLHTVLEEIKQYPIEITITGGEPTLNIPRLVKTMEILNSYGFPCRTFSTTGRHLLAIYKDKYILQHMKDNGFIHNINISRMSISDKENYEIFKNNKNITEEMLRAIAMFCNMNDMDMRVSCNLIPGKVDSIQKMINYVKYYKDNLNIKYSIFRELVGPYDKIYISDIFDEINHNSDFVPLRQTEGLFYIVNEFRYEDFLVKCYSEQNIIRPDIVNSLSYNNGNLRVGFSGLILKG